MHSLSIFCLEDLVSLFGLHKNKYLNLSISVISVEGFCFGGFFASLLRSSSVHLCGLRYFNKFDFVRLLDLLDLK